MDRKRHLILTNMLMLAAAATLAIVAALERLDAAILLSLTALLAVGAALNSPAWAASVPLTVPRRSLTQALVLNSVGFNIARAIGPAMGGLILAVAGATAAFAANAASFAFVAVVAGILLTFPRTQTTIDVPPEPFRSAMRIGLAYALAEPVVRSTLVRSAAFFGCASAIWALLPLYVRQVLGLSSASFGLMMGVIGAGAVLGGLMMPQLHRSFSRDNLIMLAGASCSLALVPTRRHSQRRDRICGPAGVRRRLDRSAPQICRRRYSWRRHRGYALASGAVSGGVQRRHGPGRDLLGRARRVCGAGRNDFRRGTWRLRDRAADASGAAPGRDR
jgi:MFS family permease